MLKDLFLRDEDDDPLTLERINSEQVILYIDYGRPFTLDLDTAATLHAWLGEYIREELTK